jgi:shikimate kinase
MGTGKTTIGKLVAELMEWPFVDTDDEIVKQAGKSIPDIFAEDGEVVFRHHERRVCRFYAAQDGYVIATGGGMLVYAENREVMRASCYVICLLATKAAIQARLQGQTGRPLFSGDWEALYDQRAEAYDAIPNQIDTSDRSPEAIAKEIVERWQRESR